MSYPYASSRFRKSGFRQYVRSIVPRTLGLLSCALFLAPLPASAAERSIALDTIYSTPAIWGTSPASPTWSGDGKKLAFLWNDKGERFMDIWLVEAAGTAPVRLTDMKAIRPDPMPDDKRTDEEKKAAEKMERGVAQIVWSPDGRSLVFNYLGDLWILDRSNPAAKPRRLTHTAANEGQPSFSPDGQWLSFQSAGDIWLFHLSRLELIQLTRLAKGRDVNVAGYAWAPSGARMSFALSDQSRVGESPIPDYISPDGPSMSRPKRVFPGKEEALVKYGVVSVPEGALSWIEPEPAEGTGRARFRSRWSPDGKRLLFDGATADQKHRWLLVSDVTGAGTSSVPASPSTLKAKVLFHETDVVNYWGPVLLSDWTPDGGSVIFVSDKDGDYHLYRMPTSGGDAVPLTRGPWQVTAMDVPEKGDGKTVYFSSTMAGPNEVQLYAVDAVRGGEPVRLTNSPGTHQAVLSPDGKRFAAIYTNDVLPPDLYLAETGRGGPMRRITHSALPAFAEYGWITPRYVTFPSRKDGAVLHARLVLPPDYKEGTKYPLILGSVYNNTVRNRWSPGNAFDLFLAREHGFIVMNVDIRASTPYGRKFRQAAMGDLGGIDLEDLISGVEYLDREGMIDRDRVGIWGWSYGGFLSLMAKFKAPDVFKVGVAGAPVSNWLHDTTWVVPLLGDPKDNAEAYRRTSPITYAGDLKGKLLIVHAMGDERVLFQDTAAVVDKLIRAKKDVDVVWAPKGGHGYDPSDEGQYNRYKRIADYFIQHLGSGPTPPKQ